MTRSIFIVWLSAGVVLGWMISRIFELDHRRSLRLIPVQVSSSEKD